jgi:NAD(P)-dependent dehydrogenase (short-subunit alcohol dehydrogenase family)
MNGRQKAVFITGAAAGIGRATALTFARKGFTVGGFDIDEVGLKTLADEIDQLGATGSDTAGRAAPAVVGHLDVTDPDEMAQRVGEFAKAAGGRLDVMINNAGILRAGRFEEMDIGGHLKEIDINVKGVVTGLYAAFPYLRSTPNAVVVNLASASAIYGQAELANYSATKFFVRGITEALDLEWNRYGIRVIAMWPLYVQTAMLENVKTGTTESLGIRLTAQDIADAIVAATEPSKLRRAIHQVHFPVGVQTKVLAAGSHFSPGWLTRLVNKRLAHS